MSRDTTVASSSSSGGIGLFGATFLVFLVLKLLGKIDWSWWWVTAPLWGPALFVIAVLAVALIVVGIRFLLERRR